MSKRFLQLISSVFAAVLLIGCSNGKLSNNEFVAVASFNAEDTSFVRSALNSHQISCHIHGSVLYGVWVSGKDYDRAVEILTKDAVKNNYLIKIVRVGERISL